MAGIAALAIAYVLSQFYRSFLAVLTPALTAELGATKAQLSLASGAFFIAFALAQFAIGVSLDRFGPKRTASLVARPWRRGWRVRFCGGIRTLDDYGGDGADRHRLRAGIDGDTLHLRASLFNCTVRRVDVLDGGLRYCRQRDWRCAAGKCGGGLRLAAGDGRAWRDNVCCRACDAGIGERSGTARRNARGKRRLCGIPRSPAHARALADHSADGVELCTGSGHSRPMGWPLSGGRLWRGCTDHRPGNAFHGARDDRRVVCLRSARHNLPNPEMGCRRW